MNARRVRADRILDTAKDLLLRWGYRRIRIDEVAKRSGVGKGTVYLHWRTREQMLSAVGTRETAEMIDAVAAAIRADPQQVMPHRLMRRIFLEAMQRPVLRAIYTQDVDTMDALVADSSQRSIGANFVGWREYLSILHEHGLLGEGLRPEDVHYPLTASVFGFFAAEPMLPDELRMNLDEKADQLANMLRRAFEPIRPPGTKRVQAAADKVGALYERLAGEFRTLTYGGDDDGSK
ncbi:TetR/AcrR family transcriptional regulator [Mycolicibacterium celeriflavum]|uniref:TetR family transcriptional regulator n=1 Tax=Mycolicibacterium celeriflavum TaxID=1249101 RepID=A0A1X0BXT6_MYCCF|nr:TetR/AcrR family transcriptional regulator [Mycolicibacterium celeriflavum]MCV7237149.1 TetR/AcrR family transcriptional regulator [Mycolicibacterium celeriflavum]ORA49243.1 TetR family transcriptional regulator [Mycolicibacterium celeriflavum]BBY41846.1 TetR family transcriptional regulator [Mycolicibacterium celeriflavum]